jgi:multidrug efflux pump subunit AcrA (membrane-fusion protein)
MKLSETLKPALAVVGIAALAGGYYWREHRPRPEARDTPTAALVVVTKSTNACFSDLVRATGFVVPRREAVAGVDLEGFAVTDVLVHEGDLVTDNQELARLTPLPLPVGTKTPAMPSATPSVRAPAAGVVIEVRTVAGAPALPQAGPMFRIAVHNEVELDAEVPAIHMLKLNPGANARISRDNAPDIPGRVRLVSPQVDRTSQLGHVRISPTDPSSLRVGLFARASIDARRSCGVAIPRTAIDHLTVQVVKNNVVEMRQVQIGLVSDTATEILAGLTVGEIVVADAGSSLHDGDQVKTLFAEDLGRAKDR